MATQKVDPIQHLVNLSDPNFEPPEEDPEEGEEKEESTLEKEQSTEKSESSKKTEDGPDLQSQLDEAKKEIKALQQKESTAAGRRRVQEEKDATAEESNIRMASLEKMVKAMATAQAEGSSEELGTRITEIDNADAQQKAVLQAKGQYDKLSLALVTAAHDDDEKSLLTADQLSQVKSEWANAREVWTKSGYRDVSALTEVVLLTSQLAITTERANTKKTKEEEDEAKKEAEKKAREDSGEGELDLGAVRMSGGRKLDDMSPKDLIAEGLKDKENPSRIFVN